MFRKLSLIAVMSALLLVAVVSSALAWVDKGDSGGCKDGCRTVAGSLSDEEAAGLVFMREEEKLAGDVYRVFYEMWGHPVFSAIAASEDRHTAAVARLLDGYGIDDPIDGLGAGVFADPSLQALYDDLVARGSESLEAAAEIGVLIEEIDIADLQERLALTDDPVIIRVYGHLLDGSQRHLSAFQRVLEADGAECAPTGDGPGAARAGVSGRSGQRRVSGR